MRAQVGDKLVVVGHHVGEHGREAEILEVHGRGRSTSVPGAVDRDRS